MSRSRRPKKWKYSWRPSDAVKLDARRHRARQAAAMAKGVDMPLLERSRDTHEPWAWD